MTGKNILNHAGKVSHQNAMSKANREYEIYRNKIKNELTKVEEDFMKQIEQSVKKLKDRQ